MTKKTRLIILLCCVVCFFVVAPILVAYSEGYRFDFEKMKIVATGGIYVRTFPSADKITIDGNISDKPGIFLNWIFVQSLLPKNHTVSIKKNGYYDYFKTLPVEENQVTKLENVLLIKKAIAFSNGAPFGSDKIDYFSAAPNNQNIITAAIGAKATTFNYFGINNPAQPKIFSAAQVGTVADIKWSEDSNWALIKIQGPSNIFYYLFDSTLQKPSALRLSYLDKNSQQISFSPQDSQTVFYIKNKTLYSAKGNGALPIINNVISFKISGTNITWLSTKGTLFNSDLSGKLINQISLKDLPVESAKTYEILFIYDNTFLKEDSALFELNQKTKIFESFNVPLTNYEILDSPDNNNLIFWSDNKIYLYSFADTPIGPGKKFVELFSGSQIANLQWLNNEYIIFTAGDKIMISETDYRGNINSITLPQTASSIFFDQQNGKLYVLTNSSLLESDKITP